MASHSTSSSTAPDRDPFECESEVRVYCRRMPAVLVKGCNAEVWDEDGRRFIDLLSACGALNYGHNHPRMRARLIAYLQSNGIATAMDLRTVAKRNFLDELKSTILRPRGLNYKVQFTGPTGTNAVEAALKLARKVTRRKTVVAFSNAFHGASLGSLAVTANPKMRQCAGVPLGNVHWLPFDQASDGGIAALESYAAQLRDDFALSEWPAAFIVETVQGEGGLNVAGSEWLAALAGIANQLGSLLIVDDIQAGCGRTGRFFSFERAGIYPDIVCLGKSIGGMGLPLSLVLLKPEIDAWAPGEHNGTFRGNNLAFITGAAALALWRDPSFELAIDERVSLLSAWLAEVTSAYPTDLVKKGLGLMQGLSFTNPVLTARVADAAIRRGLLIETCGVNDEVLKIMPPLTIEHEIFLAALARLRAALDEVLASRGRRLPRAA